MADIQEFFTTAAKDLGTSESSTSSATGAVLGLLQKEADPGDFQQLLQGIPGAQSLVGEAAQEAGAQSGGTLGGLGGLVGKAASALGGNLGGGANALATLQQSGLSLDKAGSFVNLFMKFAQSQVGKGLVGKILGKVPDLAKFVG